MKLLITGTEGQLGFDVKNEAANRGIICICPTRSEMDITIPSEINCIMEMHRPDALIHCAGWTAVDAAEDEENISTVRKINAGGTENLARACKTHSCKMMYISTDYVFSGKGKEPWEADCDAYMPLSIYGQTKLEGELAVKFLLDEYFIVRIAWLFGKNGNNFVRTMLKIGKMNDTVRVVNDQIGTPTYSADLATLLVDMIQSDKYGYYHVSNEGGYISWYEFACEIFNQSGYPTKIIPVSTKEYGLNKATRPLNSRLDKSKLVKNCFKPLPDWKNALSRYLMEISNNLYGY